MKNIQILRLTLENFKCHTHLTLDFRGASASIYGDNATGKTSLYDALTWLLFGKDSQGNGEKNIEIKPLNSNGDVKDHMAQTSVEATLLVDGEELILKRTYQEVWTTKRGSSDATYDGNTSEYFVDGVPCKKFAFAEKVGELVDEETFRMLTNVSHFANGISWQERRAVLFKVANIMDDEQIMASNEAFLPLIEGRGRLSLEDYKKKLLAEKRGFVGAKNEIPARISECQKTIADVEALDFAAAKAEIHTLNAQKESLEAQILALEHDGAAENKRLEIRAVSLDMEKLEGENRAYRASQTQGTVNVTLLKDRLGQLLAQKKEKETRLSYAEKSVDTLEKDIAASRERWISTNNEAFVTSGTCPTCGQALPAAQQKAASDAFEANKRHRLLEIEQTAAAKKESKAQMIERMEELKGELAQIENELAEKQSEISIAEASAVEPVDMDGYAQKKSELEEKIASLSRELADLMTDTSGTRAALQQKIAEIRTAVAVQNEICAKESLLEYSRKRVEELKEDAKNASECLDAVEKMLYLIDEYTRYKTKFVEESINAQFKLASFRLFREQANGGVEDRCDVVVDGVPYISVNNGAKINVGLDIINTLSKAYGVRVPLFVDNAESVTKLEHFDGQIIRLVVSENDKELRVSYEN